MADQEHLKILQQGEDAWNDWRDRDSYRPQLRGVDFRQIDVGQMDLSQADLSDANFSGKDLSNRDLSETDLTGANFNGANLSKARLVGANLFLADLIGANLRFADLQAADFRYANLRNAKLRETYLGGADLTGAAISGASFHGALFNATVLGNNDLSVVTGLESINHNGPSIIGIDTLYRSKGNIPRSFLLGCGVSEQFIAGLPSLITAQQSKMFDSCFISYDNRDQNFVGRLVSRMHEAAFGYGTTKKMRKVARGH